MKEKTENDDTFIKVTNKDIFLEMKSFHEKNDNQHKEIINRLDITNGKVKLNKWVATTALALITTLIFLLMSGIIK